MAWARPGFVPRRVLPELPDARAEALVLITADGTVAVKGETVVEADQQPFGALGARRLTVGDRLVLVPNVEHRALILDLTGSSPLAVPAPLTGDPERARRIDLGYRYIGNGRLRLGLELLASGTQDDGFTMSLVDLVTRRLDGSLTMDDSDVFASVALSIGSSHPLLARWALAPHSAITVVSARSAV
jgi:hypothetical protein